MILNLYYLDILIFSLFLSQMLIFGSSHEEQIYRAIIVMSGGIYASVRYPFLKPVHSIFCRKELVLWLLSFFSLYFFYGNFYIADISTFGSNSSAFLLMFFLCTVILFLTPYSNERLKTMLEISFSITLLLYIFYIINGIMNMNVEQMLLYRVGENIDGEAVVNGNSNTVSLTISMLSTFLFFNVFNGKCKIYVVIPLILSVIAILLTGAKAGFFSILIQIFLNLCLFSKITVKKIILLCVAIGGIIYIVFNNEYLYLLLGTRLEEFLVSVGLMETAVSGTSTDMRSDMYTKGISMWMDAPILGNGLGAFTAYSGFHMYSHNTYTEILSSLGIVGFIIFYYLPVITFYKVLVYQKKHKFKLAIILSVMGFFFDTTSIKFLSYIAMLMVIVLYIFVNNYECDIKKLNS